MPRTCRRSTSPSWVRTFISGFSDRDASWKTMPTAVPRIRSVRSTPGATTTSPASSTVPDSTRDVAFEQPDDGAGEGGLAAAGLADDADDLAAADLQVDAVEQPELARRRAGR